MKLKVWVEVFTREAMTEDFVDVPDAQWNAMTPADREAFKADVFNSMRDEVANGGCEEVES